MSWLPDDVAKYDEKEKGEIQVQWQRPRRFQEGKSLSISVRYLKISKEFDMLMLASIFPISAWR